MFFFTYGYSEKRSKTLHSVAKEKIPNFIISTCFKKHYHEIMNERWYNEKCYDLFFYLPSTTDKEKKINLHWDNVNLNHIDCSLAYLSSFSLNKEVSFRPDLLNSSDEELKNPQAEILYRFFRRIAETSNDNLVRDVDHLLAVTPRDNSKISWIRSVKQRYGSSKFKLTY